jgi:hypothetical protein
VTRVKGKFVGRTDLFKVTVSTQPMTTSRQ